MIRLRSLVSGKVFWWAATLGFFGGSLALVFTGDDASQAVAAESATAQSAKAEAGAKAEEGPGPGEPSDVAARQENASAPHAGERGGSSSQEDAAPEIRKTAEGCLADAATLDDLQRQRRELDARQTALGAREAELKTRESAVAEQLKSLQAAREDIEKIDQGRKADADAKVTKVVETVESMNPKAAATLLAGLDEGLATATMAKLSTAKLAKVMNVMDPARSARLSEILAGVARAKTRPTSNGVAVATNERNGSPSKGGDSNDGKSHEQQSSNRTNAERNPGSSR